MEACFDDLLVGQGEGAGWRQRREPEAIASASATLELNHCTLWGGNLTVLTSLLGTPYFPAVKRGILFLEDVGEHPYRVERMLTQLLYSGVLARQKALVFGQFTEFKLVSHDRGFKLSSVMDWLRQQIKVPVLTNLPYGHVATKVLLPVGATVDLTVDGRDALIFWGSR
jgi:muramoyltetrapeptide carboxypeptidase